MYLLLRNILNTCDKGEPADNWNQDKASLKEIFTALNGHCLQVDINTTDTQQASLLYLYITYVEEFQVYITDPNRMVYHMVNPQTLHGHAIRSSTGTVWSIYLVEFTMVHWQKKNGECLDYGEADSSRKTYASCVADEYGKTFKPILGCAVPWMSAPGNGNTQIFCHLHKELD